MKFVLKLLLLTLWFMPQTQAAENLPWGTAKVNDIDYKPSKVIYDLTSGKKQDIVSILDRASYLSNLYDADPFESSIVVIIHDQAIDYFVRQHYAQHKDLMKRAQSLTVGTTIEFRMCKAAAKVMGYEPADVHGFITMVPMADAEIVRLQRDQGYAYMR